MSKNWVFGHFLGNATINFFDFLHDDRGKHCATFGLGVWFQKNNPGISWGLSVKNDIFDIFLETLPKICLIFCMMIEAKTV